MLGNSLFSPDLVLLCQPWCLCVVSVDQLDQSQLRFLSVLNCEPRRLETGLSPVVGSFATKSLFPAGSFGFKGPGSVQGWKSSYNLPRTQLHACENSCWPYMRQKKRKSLLNSKIREIRYLVSEQCSADCNFVKIKK